MSNSKVLGVVTFCWRSQGISSFQQVEKSKSSFPLIRGCLFYRDLQLFDLGCLSFLMFSAINGPIMGQIRILLQLFQEILS